MRRIYVIKYRVLIINLSTFSEVIVGLKIITILDNYEYIKRWAGY